MKTISILRLYVIISLSMLGNLYAMERSFSELPLRPAKEIYPQPLHANYPNISPTLEYGLKLDDVPLNGDDIGRIYNKDFLAYQYPVARGDAEAFFSYCMKHGVDTIISLVSVDEIGRNGLYAYYPDGYSEKNSLFHGEYLDKEEIAKRTAKLFDSIAVISIYLFEEREVSVRLLKLINKIDNSTAFIRHIQIREWPDKGVDKI